MSPSLDDIAGQMRAALSLTDPDLDTSIGTTTRKIIDAVAESIGESYLDQHMLSYTYDVDAKMEGDLDAFCQAVGGISRLAAKRASGTVTFTRSGSTDRTIFIPINAQINSSTYPQVSVQTLSGASMVPGQLSVTVPVQAIQSGPIGNVAPYTLTQLATSIEGVTIVSNLQALQGGTFQETDPELRTRWKNTAFRSNAGTEQMYLGLALNDEDVTSAVVIGSSKRRREQVQIVGGVATTTVTDCAYAFPTGVYLGPSIDDGVMLIKDVDYTWDLSTPTQPVVRINSGVTLYDTGVFNPIGNVEIMQSIEGAIFDLDFEYTPTSSRNDPIGSRFGGPTVMNRVDVWCSGNRPKTARQSVVFQSSKRFSATSTDPYYSGNFVNPNGTNPAANNVFLPLAFGPILSLPDTLSIGGSTYGRYGVTTPGITYPNAYHLVHDNTSFGYTATSRFGLEWNASLLPANNAVFSIGDNGSYIYNEVPRSVQAQISRWRLAGTDAQVHSAKQVYLRFSIAVMYNRGADASAPAAIDAAVALYLSQTGLGGVVQASDIEQVIHNVAGVDNVRLMDPGDYPSYTYANANNFGIGIQTVLTESIQGGQTNSTPTHTYISPSGQQLDVVFGGSEIPVLESVVKYVKAQNSFHH